MYAIVPNMLMNNCNLISSKVCFFKMSIFLVQTLNHLVNPIHYKVAFLLHVLLVRASKSVVNANQTATTKYDSDHLEAANQKYI